MASCSSCSKDVGCGCNLIGGLCTTCYGTNLTPGTEIKRRTSRVIYSQPGDPLPNTEFEIILKTQGLSKEEKIKRINDILEKARQTI
jgi:hypothetical protein